MQTETTRFVTNFRCAEDIMSRVKNTHIQVSHELIVRRTAIVDIFDSMGIVCFSDGSAEYYSQEFRNGLINYFRTRPKCGCGLYYKRTDDSRKFWFCKNCTMKKKIKENYG